MSTDPTLTDEELAEMVADDPYDSTRTRKKLRTVAAALRASREEVERLRSKSVPPAPYALTDNAGLVWQAGYRAALER